MRSINPCNIQILAILVGTVFLIVEYDWSAWWMLLAVCLLGTSGSKE
jgi:hypothetical protein